MMRETSPSTTNRSTTCCRIGFPASARNCFGMSPPKREPEPAAGTMTKTDMSAECRVPNRLSPAPMARHPVLSTRHSDLHDVRFLVLQHTGHFVDVLVGELLDLVEAALLVVLGDLVALQHLLELFVAVAADLADGGSRFLGHVVAAFDELLAP